MDATRPASYDLADYLGMLRRHWWVIGLLLVAGIGGAGLIAHEQPRVYESSTSVLVTPTGVSGANAAGGRTSGTINLDTEAQLVLSTDIATGAQKLLKVTTPPDQLAINVTVTVPANTTVLVITYSAGTPREAQAGSHAFAIAYLQNRQTTAQADLTTQISALDAKVRAYSDSLSQLSNRLATMAKTDPNRADLTSQVATLTGQINTLTSRENDLATTQVTAGKIINDAALPAQPSRPSVPLFLASGAMVGLLLGVGVALVRERTDKRVRRPVDVARRHEVPVLATVPRRARPRADDVYPPHSVAGRLFHRLRNEVLASLADGGPVTGGYVIVVTGASRGLGATLVAANLAAALARSGSEVVLVCAQSDDAALATGMIGVAAVPGLSEVVAGKVGLDEAVQRAPRVPYLRVLTTGGTASAGGLLQSQALRDTIARLRTGAEYVVVEAPSAAASADAQSLASQADAAIIAVELRRCRHAEIVDAAEQLRRVGTPLLGAVVFARLGKPVATSAAPSDATVVMERVEAAT
jgi:Mrp family chromosome partitioning ATPase/capsular polysaccharide biosynthesis protein